MSTPNYNFQTLFAQTQNLVIEYKSTTDSNYKGALEIVINTKLSTLQTVVSYSTSNQLRLISSITI